MFSSSGESKIEVLKFYFKSCGISKEIGKIHKLSIILVELSLIYKQHYKFRLYLDIIILDARPFPNTISKITKIRKTNPTKNICDGIILIRRVRYVRVIFM